MLMILRRVIKRQVLLVQFTITFCLLLPVRGLADDTDIYLANNNTGSPPYLMMAMDYRQDLSGPYCKTTGPTTEQCLTLLDTPETFSLLQALDVIVNGVPSGAADGDADGDGLRDSAADMTAFEASKIQALIAVTQAVFIQFNGIYVGLKIPNNDGGGTILRRYREFESIDLDGDSEDDPGYQTEIHTSIDESVIGQDLNGDGDALDVVTSVSEAALDDDINDDGDKVDIITESYPGAGGFLEYDINGAKTELISILQSLPMPSQGNDFHESQPKEMHYEWYRYINGGDIEFGDQTANNFQATNIPSPDTLIFNAGSYESPFSSTPSDFECTKFYEIYATSGNESGQDADLDAGIAADMDADASSSYEDMVGYMSTNDILSIVDGDQKLKTWIIQVGDSAAKADDWAEAAGTDDQYMTVAKGASLADLKATLESAFIEALSVSATFVSASVPVNVFNRIQTLDNFYIALFEAKDTERWPGNVKKLKLSDSDADGEFDDIVDALDNSAFSDADGRIKFEASTFWTDTTELPTADSDRGEIDGRDGRSVDRGGAGQKIPGFIADDVGLSTSTAGARQVYVEPASGAVFDEFNANSTVAAALETLLGAADTNEAEELIAWARGVDVDDEDNDGDDSDVRPWLMGDAIHSRPLALNYGATGSGYTTTNPQIRLFMGTNAGFFHIFENTGSSATDEKGEEVFSFIPRESLSIIKELRVDDGSNNPHPYGVDGAPVALVVDDDNDGTIESGDEVYVYVGMRRGGKSYYALDVSDPTATPTLKWKITKTSGGNFDELGYSFSTPRVVKIQYETTSRDVLIFTGGYDLLKDGDTGAGRGGDSEGNAIYIVDARTGDLVWKAVKGSGAATDTVYQQSNLDHSIPSSVAPLDSNGNGIVDRLYVGDTSGIVWRVDLPEGTATNHRRDNWEITKFADVDDAAESEDRRFFHPPDIVQTKDGSGSYDGILIETGDRASPLETIDENMLFLIKDRNVTSGNPSGTIIDEDNLVDTTACVTGNETGCDSLDYSLGWKIDLAGSGEKGLASPLVAAGQVFFTTYKPSTGASCAPAEGDGTLYVVNLSDATAVYDSGRDFEIGPGIPPGVTVIGDDTLIIPGTGIADPEDSDAVDKSKLLQTGGKSFFIYYWREKDVDYLD